MKHYGMEPKIVGEFDIKHLYGTYILYMPIKMANDWIVRLPENLSFLAPMIKKIQQDYGNMNDKYMYLSFETSYVRKGISQKRPGWHADGFMTNDINYVWYSDYPTIFNRSKFNVTQDHNKSIAEFEAQALPENDFTLPNKTLIKMDQYNVHKAQTPECENVRTFIKISISNDKYNLKGNTHNPLFKYEWEMHDRNAVRNHPQLKEADFIK